jgi:hypothetical protein
MPKEQPATKVCRACGEEKPWGDFYETQPGYRKSVCKRCDNRKAADRALRRRLGVASDKDGMSYSDIAKEMKLPVWQVEKIERKALVKLRRAMGGWG